MPRKRTGRPPGRPRKSDAAAALRGDPRRRQPGWKPSAKGKRNQHRGFPPRPAGDPADEIIYERTVHPPPAIPLGHPFELKPPHTWCKWPGAPKCRNLPCRVVVDTSGARYDESVLTARPGLAHLFRRP